MRTLLLLLSLLFSLTLSSCASSKALALAKEAESQLALEHFKEAASLYNEASVLQPKSAHYLYNSLWSLYQEQEYERVVTLSEEAHARFSDQVEFLLLKAKALVALGEDSEAYSVLEMVFALEVHPEPLMEAAMVEALAMGYKKSAATLALSLLEHKAHEEQALKVLAEIYPDRWYEKALVYLNRQSEKQDQ